MCEKKVLLMVVLCTLKMATFMQEVKTAELSYHSDSLEVTKCLVIHINSLVRFLLPFSYYIPQMEDGLGRVSGEVLLLVTFNRFTISGGETSLFFLFLYSCGSLIFGSGYTFTIRLV